MKIDKKLQIVAECAQLSEEDLKLLLSGIGGSHSNVPRWISGDNGCGKRYRPAVAVALSKEIPGFHEEWFTLTDETFRSRIEEARRSSAHLPSGGIISALIEQEAGELANIVDQEEVMRGLYFVTRKHSRDDMLCRELLIIKGISKAGINAVMVNYKGDAYYGKIFKMEGSIYIYLARARREGGFIGRMIILSVEPERRIAEEFSGVLLRTTTSEARPIAAAVLCRKIQAVTDIQQEEMQNLFEERRVRGIEENHWLRTDPKWLINKIDPWTHREEVGAEWYFLTESNDTWISSPTVAETIEGMRRARRLK